MWKRIAFISVAAVFCLGASCTIHITPDGDGGDGQVYLDQTDANLTISQKVGEVSATVSATIVDSLGRTVELTSDQAVEVNAVALSGPNAADKFTASIPTEHQYEITVVEPTRGVESTTVEAPDEFAITSPAAGGNVSLSGFTLKWSSADNRQQVRIKMSQTYEETTTRSFGPYTDTGMRQFTASDLEAFRHGGDLTLTITVTKINTVNDVAGFATGKASAQVSTSQVARPGP